MDIFVQRATRRMQMFNSALATSDTWLKRMVTIFIVTVLPSPSWSICFIVMMVIYLMLFISAQCWIWRTPQRIYSLSWMAGFMCNFSWRESTHAPLPLPDEKWHDAYMAALRGCGKRIRDIPSWHLVDAVLSYSSPLPTQQPLVGGGGGTLEERGDDDDE
jgi:hypothetical protein